MSGQRFDADGEGQLSVSVDLPDTRSETIDPSVAFGQLDVSVVLRKQYFQGILTVPRSEGHLEGSAVRTGPQFGLHLRLEDVALARRELEQSLTFVDRIRHVHLPFGFLDGSDCVGVYALTVPVRHHLDSADRVLS